MPPTLSGITLKDQDFYLESTPHAAIAVMHQCVLRIESALMQCLLQCIESALSDFVALQPTMRRGGVVARPGANR